MSSVEQNKQTTREFLEALNVRPFHPDSIRHLIDPHFTSTRAETVAKGRDAWLDLFNGLLTSFFTEFRFEIKQIVGGGDQVWVFGVIHGLPSFVVADPTKEQRESVDLFTFTHDGKILSHRDVQQNALLEKKNAADAFTH